MTDFVVATAGHVDHGKSTLLRALTGMEADRWAEERRRGLTIDLGFVWTTLPSGRAVAFVDVPGHERFIGNMLAGLGPVPVVCFLVAADAGWQAQSSEHRDAVAALGIRHGLLVVSRADRAPDRVAEVTAQARAELADTGLRDAPAVAVAALHDTGVEAARSALDEVLGTLPTAPDSGRVRVWVDRSFTITGAGTVLTGTLAAGTVHTGDRLDVLGADGPAGARPLVVRGLESRGAPHTSLGPVNRVALNVRGAAAEDIRRGDVLLTPGAWPTSRLLDIRRSGGAALTEAPERVTVHLGTVAVPARLRPFDAEHGRLTLSRALPVVTGDRLVLRHPGTRRVLGGALVLDAEPPALRRRGAGDRRATALAAMDPAGDPATEVARRGAVRRSHLDRLGITGDRSSPPEGVLVLDDWWVHEATHAAWLEQLRTLVRDAQLEDPLAPGPSLGAARDHLRLPDPGLLAPLVSAAGLVQEHGHLTEPGRAEDLGPAEAAVAELERRLGVDPFAAPEADDLRDLGLGQRELATAERRGRLLRLRDGVVLLPTAPALAMRTLAGLPQPFTTSQARQALGTTRRVAIPLLEHLDGRGWTRRLDAGHRQVCR
ncbi:selenocysteine-specific translation elongation factor [Ornithinicoccus hortensis]|uniref:Selenocysteine-specific elongation factor n=1 Tax=Ornithinicoccus hortensis TaxID=82346 RepID=A0A542YMN1_9MICO|nr:SelB C-terminal domain-containing protein [Ornithinicoccus hortensis]TQL49346.1 selenocysteine-specific elongation factor [Ornithinicoccus hortensis]